MSTTTIRLPEDLKARVAAAAKRSGMTAHGYVASYRYVAKIDTVFVLAVRSQRGAGYAEAVPKKNKSRETLLPWNNKRHIETPPPILSNNHYTLLPT